MSVREQLFGADARRFTIANANGLSCSLITFGATLVSLRAPDRGGTAENIVLSLESLDHYQNTPNFLGSTVGRFANRIGGAAFLIDGVRYEVPANEAPNHLHGGPEGFHQKNWDASILDDQTVRFRCESPDGEGGYPGNAHVTVTYTLNDGNELITTYGAETDAPTLVNMTNHAYWNLAGAGRGDVLGHHVRLESDAYLEVDEGLIPTGRRIVVDGGPLDFREARRIGERISEAPLAPRWKRGYDHCFVIRQDGEMSLAATVHEPASGRKMTVHTSQPTFMFYTGNSLDGVQGAGGCMYSQYGGFCLEMQHHPDAPNHPEFPSTILRPGEIYRERTIHRFSSL